MCRHEMISKTGKNKVVTSAQCIIYVNAGDLYFSLLCTYTDFEKNATKWRTTPPTEKEKETGIADLIKSDFVEIMPSNYTASHMGTL